MVIGNKPFSIVVKISLSCDFESSDFNAETFAVDDDGNVMLLPLDVPKISRRSFFRCSKRSRKLFRLIFIAWISPQASDIFSSEATRIAHTHTQNNQFEK